MKNLPTLSSARLGAGLLGAALVLCSTTAHAQEITQILDATGDGVNVIGSPGYQSLAVDILGNTYVTGSFSNNAFRIAVDGTVEQLIDGLGDGMNDLSELNGIVVDGSGNVYVAGTSSHNVFKITPAGTITQIIDETGDGTNALAAPYYLHVTPAGTVYVSGFDSNNLFKIDPSGAITLVLDGNAEGAVTVEGMNFIDVDDAGNVFVTGYSSHNAIKIAPDGTVSQIIDASGDGVNDLFLPDGLALDAAGNVFIAGAGSSNVFRVEPDGDIVQILDATGDGASVLGGPSGIAVTHSGSVFVAGVQSDNVFEVTAGGVITEVMDALGDGTNPLQGPYAVATSFCGNLFVSGGSSDNVFRVDLPGGEIQPDFRLGAKLVGGIDAAEGVADTDEFSFYATAGTKLTLVAKPTGKGGAAVLVPSFTVAGPDEALLAASVLKGKAASIKGVVVVTTGLHVMSVSGLDGSTGTYQLKTKGKFPSKLNEIVEVGVDGGFVLFDGVPGLIVKTLRIKALAPKGAFATVGGEAADLRPQVTALLSPCGAPTPLGLLKTNKSGKAVVAKNVRLVSSGTQRLDIEGDGSVGFAKVIAKLKFERGVGEVSEKE